MGVLKLSKLSLSAGGKHLADLDFSVNAGQILGFSGPSGSGKTTCLRTIAGQETGHSGAVYLNDHDISARSPSQRGVTLLNQNNALFAHLSVEKNVAMSLRDVDVSAKEVAQRIAEILESLELSEVAQLKPHQLSAAQQQCAVLARSLVNPAQALLLDDPFFRLGPQLIELVSAHIRELALAQGLPVIIASQDVENLLAISDTIGVFDRGRLVQIGEPLQMIRRPRNAFVASFLGKANILPGTIIRAEAGMLLIETALGELLGSSAELDVEYTEGEAVEVAIRPEAIHLDLMAPEENAFSITVEKISFRGALAYAKCIANGTPLAAIELNPTSLDASSGRELFGWVDADDVVVMKQP